MSRWLSSANKLVLAAIGTGIAGLITAAVVAVPHLADNLINPRHTLRPRWQSWARPLPDCS